LRKAEREEEERGREVPRPGGQAAVWVEVAGREDNERDDDGAGGRRLHPQTASPQQDEPDEREHEHRRDDEEASLPEQRMNERVEARRGEAEEAGVLLREGRADIAVREVEGRAERLRVVGGEARDERHRSRGV